MNIADARRIVWNAVAVTEPRWRQYAETWRDIDRVFIRRGYEQQGFRVFRFVPFLEAQGLFSIHALGGLLADSGMASRYDPTYAKNLASPFYGQLREGKLGERGVRLEEAVRLFRRQEPQSGGRFYWKLLWQMLQACSYLHRAHQGSFAKYLLAAFARSTGSTRIADAELLNTASEQWLAFLSAAKPWRPLPGIGPNVFDFIVGDLVEARFARDSYKFDSANEHFLTVTGIRTLLARVDRPTVIAFLQTLDLPYGLREINKGLYTYCSMTEAKNFGFCRNPRKCQECGVRTICARAL